MDTARLELACPASQPLSGAGSISLELEKLGAWSYACRAPGNELEESLVKSLELEVAGRRVATVCERLTIRPCVLCGF